MATQINDAQRDALRSVLDLDHHMWADLGPHLTCTEADLFAALLQAFGRYDESAALSEGHESGDDEGDAHYVEPSDLERLGGDPDEAYESLRDSAMA